MTLQNRTTAIRCIKNQQYLHLISFPSCFSYYDIINTCQCHYIIKLLYNNHLFIHSLCCSPCVFNIATSSMTMWRVPGAWAPQEHLPILFLSASSEQVSGVDTEFISSKCLFVEWMNDLRLDMIVRDHQNNLEGSLAGVQGTPMVGHINICWPPALCYVAHTRPASWLFLYCVIHITFRGKSY